MIGLILNGLQLYSELSGKKKQSDVKKKSGALAALYAVISVIIYSFLDGRVDHSTAVLLSSYIFLVGELVIGILYYKNIKSTTQPALLQSAQLVKNLIPQTLSGKQKIALIGTSLLLLWIFTPKFNTQSKS